MHVVLSFFSSYFVTLYRFMKVFLILFSDIAALKLNDDDSVSEADRDTLGPLPPPSGSSPWGNQLPYSGSYIPPNAGFMPLPFNYTNDNNSSCKNFVREGSVHSGSGTINFSFGFSE